MPGADPIRNSGPFSRNIFYITEKILRGLENTGFRGIFEMNY